MNAYSKSITIPMFILMAGGTGSMLTTESLQSYAQWHDTSSLSSNVLQKNQALSPAEQISLIRDVLQLNMSDLATLLKITRPTAYRWLEGMEPNLEAQKHIGYLASVAEKAAHLDIARMDLLIHRPLFEGHSLLDQLKENKNVDESLQTIKVIADKELANRQKIKSSGKSRVSLSEAVSYNSTPIHHG